MTILEKILKYGLYFSLFTPLFIWNKLFFPYITTKTFIFYFLIEILLVIYLIILYKNPKKFKIKKDWILYSLLIFTVISFVTGLLGVDFYVSFWSMFERMDGIFNLLHFVAFFILLRSVFIDKADWIKFLRLALFATFTISGYGIWQHFFVLGADERIYSTIGNPIYLASYLLPHIFLGLYLIYDVILSKAKQSSITTRTVCESNNAIDSITNNSLPQTVCGNSLQKLSRFKLSRLNLDNLKGMVKSFWLWFYVVITGLNIWSLFLTQTRGAILGFFIGLIVLGILSVIFSRNKNRIFLFYILPILVIISLIIFILWNTFPIERFKSSFTNPDITRIMQWEIATKSFLERPVLGWGSGNYIIAQNSYYNPEILNFTGAKWNNAHNKVLEVAVDSGIAGLLSYLFIFVAVIWFLLFTKSEKDNKVSDSILISLFVAFFAQNIFIFDTFSSYLSLFLSLAFASFLIDKDNKFFKEIKSSIIIIILIAVLFSFWYGIWQPFKTAKALSYANSFQYEGNTGKELALYKYIESLSYKGGGQYSALIYGARFINNNFPNEESINLIINKLEKYKKRVPENIIIRGFLANFYIYKGSADKKYFNLAEENIRYVIKISPNHQEFYDGLGVVLYEKGEYEEARSAYDKYYELHPAPNKADYNFKMALTYYKEGNKIKSIEHAEKVLEIDSNHNQVKELLKVLKSL